MKFLVGIGAAFLTALFLTLGLGYGIGFMQTLVIVGVGLMGYGVAEKFIGKGQ